MGAWIETAKANDMRAAGLVAPYVGAWIETLLGGLFGKSNTSRTLRGCVD